LLIMKDPLYFIQLAVMAILMCFVIYPVFILKVLMHWITEDVVYFMQHVREEILK
uniref:Uncharacterized protein n=1 Tax=Amphimedon queenslandica TaxID=400682 RepID=A0A1X7UMM9_AMPQE